MTLLWLPGNLWKIFRTNLKWGPDLKHACKDQVATVHSECYIATCILRACLNPCLCLSWPHLFKEISPILDPHALTNKVLNRHGKKLSPVHLKNEWKKEKEK